VPLKVIDAVSHAGGEVNEDRWGAHGRAAWVLDGATGIAERRVLPGPSDASWFVDRLDTGLRERAADAETPAQVLRPIVQQARQAFAQLALRPDASAMDMPCGALAMIRLDESGAELVSLGDCRIVGCDPGGAVCSFGTSKVTALDARVEDEVARLQAEGLSYAENWQRLLPMIRRHRALMNLPDGYWNLDLSERGLDHIETERWPAPSGAAFLLLSDGFYRLVDAYRRYSYATLLAAAERKGLGPLYRELRAIEDADPECRRHPRLKRCDDATAVLVRVE
jgi:hypothetical protein